MLPVIVTDKPKISASRNQVLSDIDCDRQGFAYTVYIRDL